MDEELKARIAQEASKFTDPDERERYIKAKCAVYAACEAAAKYLAEKGVIRND